jgi:hypothetical protein
MNSYLDLAPAAKEPTWHGLHNTGQKIHHAHPRWLRQPRPPQVSLHCPTKPAPSQQSPLFNGILRHLVKRVAMIEDESRFSEALLLRLQSRGMTSAVIQLDQLQQGSTGSCNSRHGPSSWTLRAQNRNPCRKTNSQKRRVR